MHHWNPCKVHCLTLIWSHSPNSCIVRYHLNLETDGGFLKCIINRRKHYQSLRYLFPLESVAENVVVGVPNISVTRLWFRCRPEAELLTRIDRTERYSLPKICSSSTRDDVCYWNKRALWIRNCHNHSLAARPGHGVSSTHSALEFFTMHQLFKLVVQLHCSWTPQNSRRYPSLWNL